MLNSSQGARVSDGLESLDASVQISDGLDVHLSSSSQSKTKASSSKAPRELKLVYRILRLISDWTLSGFFSEVCVEGVENVESEGALILTPCHHNEIIDIATLSATIPHRRIIAYWTKASLFKNPISRFIFESAGSIPVARAPRSKEAIVQSQGNGLENGAHGGLSNGFAAPLNGKLRRDPNGQQALFDATYKELAKQGGGVLGVFPEGTSYTLPRIVQVKEGAARAALGYIKWRRDRVGYGSTTDLRDPASLISVVPVGIVYTDKSRYRSRVYVKYGSPIDLRPFIEQCDSHEDSASQDAMRRLTEEIEQRMLDLTINSSNWETLYAARTSRAILWPNEHDLPLNDFVKVSKILVAVFEHPTAGITELKNSLLRYHALLHHTGLTHGALVHVPLPPSQQNSVASEYSGRSVSPRKPLSASSLFRLTTGLPTLALPLLLSFPTHLAHAPAYILASLTSRTFAGEEEEARAQYKTIFGGVGRAMGTFTTGLTLTKSTAGKAALHAISRTVVDASKLCFGVMTRALSSLPLLGSESLESVVEKCTAAAKFTATFVRLGLSRLGGLGDWIGAFGIAWLLVVWHARVIDTNYIKYKRIRATLTILRALLFSRRAEEEEVTEDEMRPYLTTPPPPINPFIAKSLQTFPSPEDTVGEVDAGSVGIGHSLETQSQSNERTRTSDRRKVSKSSLVRQLLLARADAVVRVRSTLSELEKRYHSEELPFSNSNFVCDDVANGQGRGRGKLQSYTVEDIGFLRECGAEF